MARRIEIEVVGNSRSFESALGRASSSSSKFGGALKKLSLAAGAAAGVGVAAGLGFAVKAAIDFDREMRNVNSIARLSEKEFQNVSKAVRGMAGETGQAPKVLAQGMYDIVSSGFKANAAIKILRTSARAATAGLTDTATATKAVVASLNAYHKGAEDAARVGDVLFQTVNKGVLTFEELSQNIGDVLPSASTLGVPLEEVGGALATITLHGVNASEAATQVKQVMISLLKPSKDLTTQFNKMGFETGQAAIEQLGFTGTVKALSKAAGDNKAEIATWFPNVRALGGFFGLAGKNLETFTANVEAMGTKGALAMAFAEQGKSVAVQWQKAQASLTAAAIPIGQLLFPALIKGAQGAAFLAEALNTHMPQIRRVVQQAVAGVKSALDRMHPAFVAIQRVVLQVVQAIRANWPQISSTARAVGNALRAEFNTIRQAIVTFMPLIRALAPVFRAAFTIMIVVIRVWAATVTAAMKVVSVVLRGIAPVVRGVAAAFSGGFRAAAAVVHALTAAVNALAAAIRALPSLPSLPGNSGFMKEVNKARGGKHQAAGGRVGMAPGAVPGTDSVLSLLDPREIVFNPARPDRGLAALAEEGIGPVGMARGGRARGRHRGGHRPAERRAERRERAREEIPKSLQLEIATARQQNDKPRLLRALKRAESWLIRHINITRSIDNKISLTNELASVQDEIASLSGAGAEAEDKSADLQAQLDQSRAQTGVAQRSADLANAFVGTGVFGGGGGSGGGGNHYHFESIVPPDQSWLRKIAGYSAQGFGMQGYRPATQVRTGY
jgi:TP901 family phage tail tape measure protein